MKFTKTSTLLSCAILAAMSSSFAFADDNAGWYLGGNIGQTKSGLENQRTAEILTGPTFSNTLVSDDDTDQGYKLFGGYQFNRYFAIEAGYFDLGEFSFTSRTQPLGSLGSNFNFHGANIDLVGYVPFTEKLSGFGRLGVNYAEIENKLSGAGYVNGLVYTTIYEQDANLKAGVGLEYAFNDNLALRVEAERYRVDDSVNHKDNVDMYSVGLVYRFGSKPAPAPVVITPPPVPAPAPVVAPPPAPKFEKYTLSATELFAFDSEAVNLPQPKLQQIATALNGPGSPQKIVITGYTDRLGSDAYNQKLSERRALAVKQYIVNQGVAAERLVAEGKGEADPVVQCDDKNKAALIKCLAPNRRVEIDEVKIVREVKP